MQTGVVVVPGTDADQGSRDSVAGKIESAPSALAAVLEEWRASMLARRCKPKSADQFVSVVRSAARERGWSRLSDLTAASVGAWIDERSVRWKGATRNRTIVIFRALGKYLESLGHAGGLVDAAPRAKQYDSGEGVRPATTGELERMIRHARTRCLADRRCGSARDVYYLAVAHTAGRYAEPSCWRWDAHVFFDGNDESPVPHLFFDGLINKNGRKSVVPLTPALYHVLLEHREAMRALSRERPYVERLCLKSGERIRALVDPDRPGAHVFPIVPPPHVWRSDRAAVGIPAADRRGRPFSWHSARDWFITVLTDAGVPSTAVRKLARHDQDTHVGYYGASIETLAGYIARLPALWPERLVHKLPTSGDGASDKIIRINSGLPGVNGRNMTPPSSDLDKDLQPNRDASASTSLAAANAASRGGCVGPDVGSRRQKRPGGFGSSKSTNRRMPIPRLETVDSNIGLLEASRLALLAASRALKAAAGMLGGRPPDDRLESRTQRW